MPMVFSLQRCWSRFLIACPVLVLTCLLDAGCAMTNAVTSDIRAYESPASEFLRCSSEEPVYHGDYCGRIVWGGTSCHAYQFTNALSGGRILQILFPDANEASVVVQRITSSGRRDTIAHADLLLSPPSYLPADVLFGAGLPEGQRQDPADHALILAFTATRTALVSRKEPLPGAPWRTAKGIVLLNWERRSKTLACLLRFRYLYAIPIDLMVGAVYTVAHFPDLLYILY